MKTHRYIVTITTPEDPEDPEDPELHVQVILPNGRSKQGKAAVVPLLNMVKQTIADDLEHRL